MINCVIVPGYRNAAISVSPGLPPSAIEYIQFKLQCSYLELSTPLDQLYNIIFSVTITNLVPTLSATVQRLLRGIGGVPHSFNFVSVRGLYVPRVHNDNGQ